MILKKGIKCFVDYWENIPLFKTQKSLPRQLSGRDQEPTGFPKTRLGLANSLKGMGTGSQPSFWAELSNLPMEMF